MSWLRARPARVAVLYGAVPVVLSAALVGVGIAGVQRPFTTPLAVVAWGLLVTRSVRDLHEADRSGALLLGRSATARMLLAVALGLAYLNAGDAGPAEHGWMVAAAVVVLLVCTAVEPVLHKVQPHAAAVGLPGVAPVPGAAAARWAGPVALALLGALIVVDVVGAPAVLWLLIALAQAALIGCSGALTLTALLGRDRRATELHAAIEEHAPVFALYTARRTGAYQLQMWLPYLDRLGLPYLVVVRHAEALRPLSQVVSVPVVACRTWRELDAVMVPALRAALYVNSLGANSDFVTYRQLRHIYLGHGESDKALSSHPAHAMYDTVIIAGQAAVDRYERAGVVIPREKLVIAGRPQLSGIDVATRAIDTIAAPTLLYAPTWNGYNAASSYSSLPVSMEVVRALLARPGAVVFRPHPLSRQRAEDRGRIASVCALLRADAVRTGRPHLCGADVDRLDFAECANLSDAMVTDPSSVLVDYLRSDKPVAVVAVPGSRDDLRQRQPATRAAYLLDPHDAEAALTPMLGADPLSAARTRARQHYLGDSSGAAADPAERFVAVLRGLIEEGPVTAEGDRLPHEQSR